MVVDGAVTVNNQCGILGKIHINPTIAIAPSGPTESSFSMAQNPAEGFRTSPYDPAIPVECRMYGFANPQKTNFYYHKNQTQSYVTTEENWSSGYPYNPILLPPQQLLDLDLAWKSCAYWQSDGGDFGMTYGAFDPPRMLNPETALVPPVTRAEPTTAHVPNSTPEPAAQPGAKSSPQTPKVTSNAQGSDDPIADPTSPDSDPGPAASDALPTSSEDPSTPAQNGAQSAQSAAPNFQDEAPIDPVPAICDGAQL